MTENVNSLDIIFSKTGFYDSHKLNDDYSYLDDCLKDNGNIIRKQKKWTFSFSAYNSKLLKVMEHITYCMYVWECCLSLIILRVFMCGQSGLLMVTIHIEYKYIFKADINQYGSSVYAMCVFVPHWCTQRASHTSTAQVCVCVCVNVMEFFLF